MTVSSLLKLTTVTHLFQLELTTLAGRLDHPSSVMQLRHSLKGPMTTSVKPLTSADFTAMAAIASARKNNLRTMFEGATISSGKSSAAGSAKSVLTAGGKIASSVKKLASTGADAATTAASSGGLRARAEQLIAEAV